MIRNVYCVGRNYRLHAAELGNAVPESPMIFMKPTHAAVPMDGGTIHLPASFGTVHYEVELVIRVGRAFEPGMKAEVLIDGFALGIDFKLRDLQDELKKKQHPWLKAKGFRASAPVTSFQEISGLHHLFEKEFSLKVNGQEKQRGHVSDMIFDFQTLVDAIGGHYGLGQGDVIFTGTPAGVGQIMDNDIIDVYWGESLLGSAKIELK
jgi:fumarylpyruvate hydrolase